MRNSLWQRGINQESTTIIAPSLPVDSGRSTTESSLHHFKLTVKCNLVFELPPLFNLMAPRNPVSVIEGAGACKAKSKMLPIKSNVNDAPDSTDSSENLSAFNWKKYFIQSRIMEKVHLVGDQMNSINWVEQVKTLAKERPLSFFCFALMSVFCVMPIFIAIVFVAASCGISVLSFVFVEWTLITIGSFLLGGVFVIACCVAFPVAIFLGLTYYSANFAFNLFSTTSSTIKKIVQERRSSMDAMRNSDASCTDGSPFLPPSCILDSDASALRRRSGLYDDISSERTFYG